MGMFTETRSTIISAHFFISRPYLLTCLCIYLVKSSRF